MRVTKTAMTRRDFMVVAVGGAALVVGSVTCWRSLGRPTDRSAIEGTVVSRYMKPIRRTRFSPVRYEVTIRSADGRIHTLFVPKAAYDQAEPGMVLHRSAAGDYTFAAGR
jgi:hypothetical protein